MEVSKMTQTHANFEIGRDVGTFGRWFRLIVGLYFTLLILLDPLVINAVPSAQALSFLGNVGLYFLLIMAVYLLAFYLLGERLLARVNPWVGTIVFLGPLVLLTALEAGPIEFRVAIGLYYSMASILNFAMSYGGCEVVAIPSLVFRRRYTVYCPYNAVDAVEIAMRACAPVQRVLGWLSLLISLLVGGYYILFYLMDLDDVTGLQSDPRLALLFVIPIAFLLRSAWLVNQEEAEQIHTTARRLLIGAVVMATLTIILFFQLSWEPFWLLAMLLGGLYALAKFVQAGWGQKPLEDHG
jgi:hypothetical protein